MRTTEKQGVALTDVTLLARRAAVKLYLDWRPHDVIAWPARVKPPAGPPWSVTDPTDDNRGQQPLTSLAPYTM